MPKLINADSLADRLDALAYDDWNQVVSVSWAGAFRVFSDMVRDEIAVDAEPVEHGHWIITPYGHMTCSSCEWLFEYYGGLEEEWNYCPHCGAIMDEPIQYINIEYIRH